jgi:predicted DNA-binding transcriptional regulator AlpA
MSTTNAPLPLGDTQEPLLVTALELARLLHVSLRTLWRLSSASLIPEPVRLGGTVRWRLDEIKNWIAAGCPPPPVRENGHSRR